MKVKLEYDTIIDVPPGHPMFGFKLLVRHGRAVAYVTEEVLKNAN